MKDDNPRIIQNRQNANSWVKQNIALTPEQAGRLNAYSNYFTAIHHYVDGNTTAAKADLKKAIEGVGMNWQFFQLKLKIMLGRKRITKLKNG